jgi:hypothetical protein
MAPRRTRIVLWSLAAFAVLVLGAALAIHLSIEARWSRFVAEVEALEAEAARFPTTRPVLWGDAVEADAWESYQVVKPEDVPKDFNSSPKLDEELRLKALASLRTGAHRTSVGLRRYRNTGALQTLGLLRPIPKPLGMPIEK